MTEEEALKGAEDVMTPKTTTHQFIGHTIQLRPLPMSWAKKVSDAMGDVTKMCSEIAQAGLAEMAQGKMPSPTTEMTDIEIANSILKAVKVLCDFYNIEKTEEEIDDTVTYVEAEQFIKAQLEVSNKHDFLLRPLSATIAAIEILENLQDQVSLNSQSSHLSANLGDVTRSK